MFDPVTFSSKIALELPDAQEELFRQDLFDVMAQALL